MSHDDDLAENFTSGDPITDLRGSCYAINDSLAYDQDASFLCFNLKNIVKLREVKGFDTPKFGVALFDCFKQPDMEIEIVNLRASQKQIAVVQAENRESGIDPSDAVMAKIPVFIRQGLDKLGLRLDIVPQRPPLSRLLDNEFTGTLH
jgi:hypothetical protein